MTIVSLIPARAGSKRVAKKNIKYLLDYPLIAYSIVTSLLCPEIEATYVSTDSIEIAYQSLYFGAEVPFIRPSKYAQDKSTDYDVIIHFLEEYKNNTHHYPDYIVHLRPTTPLRNPIIISKAINSIKNGVTSLRSVEPLPEAIEKTFKIKNNILSSPYLNISNEPNQSFETSYSANGYVDILKVDTILNYKNIHGDKIQAFETEKTVEIDNNEDFDYAEFLIHKKGNEIYEFLKKKGEYLFKNKADIIL